MCASFERKKKDCQKTRSSRPEVLFKKSFTKFRRKHLRRSFLIKLQTGGLQRYQKQVQHMCFPMDFQKFSTTYFEEHPQMAAFKERKTVSFYSFSS